MAFVLEIQNMKPCSKSCWAIYREAWTSVGKLLRVAVGPGTDVAGTIVTLDGAGVFACAVGPVEFASMGLGLAAAGELGGVTVTWITRGSGVPVTTTTTVGGTALQAVRKRPTAIKKPNVSLRIKQFTCLEFEACAILPVVLDCVDRAWGERIVRICYFLIGLCLEVNRAPCYNPCSRCVQRLRL